MKSRAIVVAILATFLAVGSASAQELGIGVRGGFDGPLGDFSATADPEVSAGAQTGFFFGADVLLPVFVDGLSWYSSVEYSKVRTSIVGYTAGHFVHIPIMTGLRYDLYDGAPGFFATAQAGVFMAWGPKVFLPYTEEYADQKAAMNFGYNVGLGFQLSETAYLEAKYVPATTMTYEYENDSMDRDYSSLQFGVGFLVF